MTMRRNRGFMAAVAAGLSAVAVTAVAFLVADDQCPSPAVGPAVVVQAPYAPDSTPAEDDPNWDCRIHGNRICGEGVD